MQHHPKILRGNMIPFIYKFWLQGRCFLLMITNMFSLFSDTLKSRLSASKTTLRRAQNPECHGLPRRHFRTKDYLLCKRYWELKKYIDNISRLNKAIKDGDTLHCWSFGRRSAYGKIWTKIILELETQMLGRISQTTLGTRSPDGDKNLPSLSFRGPLPHPTLHPPPSHHCHCHSLNCQVSICFS